MGDLGLGIGITGVSIAIASVIITVIKVKAAASGHSNANTCLVHHTVEETLGRIWGAIGVIQADIKVILSRGGV